jgi:protein TonB
MPRDLFGDVAVGPPSVRSRRSPVLIVSIAIHVVVLMAVLFATAVAPDILPTPRQALAFYQPARIDIQLPPPPPVMRAAAAPRGPAAPVPVDAAPVVPPAAITPETWSGDIYIGPAGVTDRLLPGIGVVTGVMPDAPPAPAPVAPPPPVRLHRGIVAPQKTVNVAPQYPELARQAKVRGLVIIEAVIDAGGNVSSAQVLRGHPMLDQAALDAVRRWKFTAARLNGEAIPVVMTVTVRFELQ